MPHQRGPKPCPEAKKQHAPAAEITAERLHRCIFHDAHRHSKCPRKIEVFPTFPKMLRVSENSSVAHRRRKTNRGDIKFPAAHSLFKFRDELFWTHSRTGSKFAFHAVRHEQFYKRAANIDDENSSLSHHERAPAALDATLSAAPKQPSHAALRFRLGSRAARPALYNFEGNEPEQQLPGGFQIQPQIFRNLLRGPGAIELGGELGLIRSQLQLLHTLVPFSCISRNRCRVEASRLVRVLDETQGFQGPVVHIRIASNVAESA